VQLEALKVHFNIRRVINHEISSWIVHIEKFAVKAIAA